MPGLYRAQVELWGYISIGVEVVRNQSKLFRSTTLVYALLAILSAVPAYAAYELNEAIINAAGNTLSGDTWELYNSIGEPIVGQNYGEVYSVQAGFFHDYFRPAPTPTPTSTQVITLAGDHHMKIFNSKINPLKGEVARVRWRQSENGATTIRIYDMLGGLVKTLVSGEHFTSTQEHEVKWDGRTNSGRVVGSGVYIVHIKSGSYQEYKKMVVIK